jgi:hypothetical protein
LLLFVVGVNGAPTWLYLTFGTFDSKSTFAYSATVPLGLEGFQVDLQAFALNQFRQAIASARETISIQ